MKNYQEELLKFQPKHIIQDPLITHLIFSDFCRT